MANTLVIPELFSEAVNAKMEVSLRVGRLATDMTDLAEDIRTCGDTIHFPTFDRISDADIVDGARDFRLMKKDMVNAIVKMGEYNRFSKGIFGWVGFKTYWISFENVERIAGRTKWNFWKLFKYALDGIINFSQMPLSIASWLGIGMTGVSVIILLILIFRRLYFGDPVAGWASIVCIIIFLGGLQLFCLGVIGQYIAKLYMESKNRPHYIIADTNQEQIEKIG